MNGREQQVLVEQRLALAGGDAQREAAAGRQTGQRGRARRLHAAHEVLQIVVQLADIVDPALGARLTMTANVQRIGRQAGIGQRPRQHVHAGAAGRRAVHQHDAAAWQAERCIGPVGQARAVAGRELAGRGQVGVVDVLERVGDAGHRRRLTRPAEGDGGGQPGQQQQGDQGQGDQELAHGGGHLGVSMAPVSAASGSRGGVARRNDG